MELLWQEIESQLAQAGTLSYARLMDLALYSEHGYYTKRVRIGKGGADFYTASQSELFALTLSKFILQQAENWNVTDTLQVVEVGAGQGELAAGIAAALQAAGQLSAVSYCIEEQSPYLQSIQQNRLQAVNREDNIDGETVVTFSWSAPDRSLPTIIIANEVLDALPVEKIRRTETGWEYIEARLADGALDWFWTKAPEPVARLARRFVNCPTGMQAEISTEYTSLMSSVLSGYGGPMAALWFDYGITREEWETGIRPEGTLRGYSQHQIVDPLTALTSADLTADVNWTQVQAAALDLGLDDVQLVSQGKFLMDAGIIDLVMARQQESADLIAGSRWTQQFKQLALPDGMGDRFSVFVCKTR